MYRSEKGDCKVLYKYCPKNDEGISDRHWSRNKSYMMKWKQSGNSHISVQVEEVRLLEQDVGGLSLRNLTSCCIEVNSF